MKITNTPRARLGCETLEARDNPAGNVSVALVGGWLDVVGDAADNQISIQQNYFGDIVVYGYGGTTVNGVSAFFVGNGRLERLTVNMGNGNDYADVAGLFVTTDMTLYGGFGNDALILYNAGSFNTVALGGGPGDDFIGVNHGVAGSTLLMYGSEGTDTLDFNSAWTGQGHWFTDFENFA